MEVREFVEAESILRIGQRVEIMLDDELYTSRIEDFDNAQLILAMPVDLKRRPLIPEKGTLFSGRIVGEQCSYHFTAEYQDKQAEPIPVWLVSMPEVMEKKQYRDFVRVKTAIPVYVQIPDEDGGFQQPFLTETKDISGNGFLFVYEQKIPLKTKIVVETEVLPQVGRIKTFAEVVRCTKPVANRNLYWIGIKFVDLARPVQNRLVQFVFQKQREHLAKRIK